MTKRVHVERPEPDSLGGPQYECFRARHPWAEPEPVSAEVTCPSCLVSIEIGARDILDLMAELTRRARLRHATAPTP